MSWVNVLMLTASIPTYETKGSKKAGKDVSPDELARKLMKG